MSEEVATVPQPQLPTEDALIKLFTSGDLIDLDPRQKGLYLKALCDKLGLNPLSKPFDILYLKGNDGKQKAILYANRTCSDQLREIHDIRSEVVYEGPLMLGTTAREDVYRVDLNITKGERTERAVGCVAIAGLSGEALSNAIMKCWTKAMRRGTLSIVGLGLPDESEVDSIPGVTTSGPAPRLLNPSSALPADVARDHAAADAVNPVLNPAVLFPKPLPAAKPPVR